MKRRIFQNIFVIVAIAVLLASVLVLWVMYDKFYGNMMREVKKEAEYVAAAMDENEEGYLNRLDHSNTNRITLIAADGTVQYDSRENPTEMENHADRPEIRAARLEGTGESTRLSETIGEQTFYYAIRLEDGRFLRVGCTTESVFSAILDCLPFILLIIAAVFIVTMVIAQYQTKRIVAPINDIDLEHPLSNEIYDEFSPLLLRMEKQRRQISAQLADLGAQREEFNSVTENMKEGLVLLSSAGAVLSINKSAAEIFQCRAETVCGNHYIALNRSIEVHEAAEAALQGRHCDVRFELNGRCYQLFATPITEERGADGRAQVAGAAMLVQDITEKASAEQMRREFTANVSHELKTPLTSISGYAEIMKNGIAKPEDIPRFAGHIYTESARLISLVDDIIQLSRLDEHDQKMPREEVDLLALSREAADRLRERAEKRGIRITVSGDPAAVYGVRTLLEEMVYNLCENAVKYNAEHGLVTVRVKKEAAHITLTVADTGIGIPPEHQARIFERFYRVDKSHSKETGGTGLGLSIVKNAAQYHNARISLESRPGEGSKFIVVFNC